MRLVHWNESEAADRAELVQSLGYQVTHTLPQVRSFLKELRVESPRAVIIDLSRLPSQGRDLAVQIRKQSATRRIPLVFVAGHPDKVKPIQVLLPDAAYCVWDEIGAALQSAIARPLEDPIVPSSAFAAYAGKPLTEKLGIKPGFRVVLVHPPERFEDTLGELPVGARLGSKAGSDGNLCIWFIRSQADLERDLPLMVDRAQSAPLWIAWPKKASGVDSDLSQQLVRETGLAAGLVDYKICSIDATWSGLLFTKR